MGHGDISFLETGIVGVLADRSMGEADKLVSGSI
jgi:hypothetical protein